MADTPVRLRLSKVAAITLEDLSHETGAAQFGKNSISWSEVLGASKGIVNLRVVWCKDKQRPHAARSRVSQADGGCRGSCALWLVQLVEG